jgi:acyl-CoA thioester hydrolase
MARLTLSIPETLPFHTTLHIRITDLNYGAHLGNDRVLAFLHEARARYLARWGITETDAYGVGMAMVDAAIQFKAEGFFGDRVEAWVGVTDLSAKSWDFLYRLELPDRGKVLALAKTGMVAFDYRERKVTRIPEALLARFREE